MNLLDIIAEQGSYAAKAFTVVVVLMDTVVMLMEAVLTDAFLNQMLHFATDLKQTAELLQELIIAEQQEL